MTSENAMVLPRIAITFCTQCKWMLRAAYFAQELLSTFGTSIGEVALIPATGGVFTVHLTLEAGEAATLLIWDRKAEGGFPETKILKQRVRDHIEPEKKLGHSDTPSSKARNGDSLMKEDVLSAGSRPSTAVPNESSPALPTQSVVDACADCEEPTLQNVQAKPTTATENGTIGQIAFHPGINTTTTASQDPLLQESEAASTSRPAVPDRKPSLALKTEQPASRSSGTGIADPLLQEAMSATMSPTDRKQAELAFLVATQTELDYEEPRVRFADHLGSMTTDSVTPFRVKMGGQAAHFEDHAGSMSTDGVTSSGTNMGGQVNGVGLAAEGKHPILENGVAKEAEGMGREDGDLYG